MNKCPFNSLDYLSGLSNIGIPESNKAGNLTILRRRIPGTKLYDGIGPWPYFWVSHQDDINALHDDFSDLVSLTIITQPGLIPQRHIEDVSLFKQHFVYDPGLPTPKLSKRANARLAKADKYGIFEQIFDFNEKLEIYSHYQILLKNRNLSDGFFDMPAQHFISLAKLENALFFRVRNDYGIGAMACAVLIGDILQILHTITTPFGLTWNASYLLMHNLQITARNYNIRMLTGGMPTGGSNGLLIFKSRWSNALCPVYMLRIINDRNNYNHLSKGVSSSSTFFPSYRTPQIEVQTQQ